MTLQGPPEAGLEPRRLQGRLDQDRGRRGRPRRAAADAFVDPGQRPSDRQGDLALPLQDAARRDRDLERRPSIRRSGRSARRSRSGTVADPMASYLALAAIGKFRVDQGEVAGIPYVGAVDRALGKAAVDEPPRPHGDRPRVPRGRRRARIRSASPAGSSTLRASASRWRPRPAPTTPARRTRSS